MCCLVFFDSYFRLHVVVWFTASGCYRVCFLVCNFYSCCSAAQVIFMVRLAPNDKAKVALWYGECQSETFADVYRRFRT